MQRLQDLGIKDVYNDLNENSSSTLHGMGTMHTENANGTLDYTDKLHDGSGVQQKSKNNNESRRNTFASDLSTIPSKRGTKRVSNENQNYGTTLVDHQKQISKQTYNRGPSSLGDNMNVFSDMTNVTYAGDNVMEQLIRPEPI